MRTLAMVALVLAVASRADAAYLLFDNPNPIVRLPSTGSTTVTITGRVSFDAGYFYNYDYIQDQLSDGAGHTLSASLGSTLPQIQMASNGGIYTGPLVTITYSANSVPGVYIYAGATTILEGYTVVAFSATASELVFGNFSLTILPAAVPEPSSLVLMGTAAATGLGIWGRRRRAA